jgi:hypothetical protein
MSESLDTTQEQLYKDHKKEARHLGGAALWVETAQEDLASAEAEKEAVYEDSFGSEVADKRNADFDVNAANVELQKAKSAIETTQSSYDANIEAAAKHYAENEGEYKQGAVEQAASDGVEIRQ